MAGKSFVIGRSEHRGPVERKGHDGDWFLAGLGLDDANETAVPIGLAYLEIEGDLAGVLVGDDAGEWRPDRRLRDVVECDYSVLVNGVHGA
jgi:hypothetical protein